MRRVVGMRRPEGWHAAGSHDALRMCFFCDARCALHVCYVACCALCCALRVARCMCCALSQIDPKKGPYLIVAAAQRAGVEADFWINVRPCRAGYREGTGAVS